jgi:hypothetical protein
MSAIVNTVFNGNLGHLNSEILKLVLKPIPQGYWGRNKYNRSKNKVMKGQRDEIAIYFAPTQ